MERTYRTLQDYIDQGQAGPYASRILYPKGTTIPHFRCRCGRVVTADMMLDLCLDGCSSVPEHLRGHDRFRCDGCWTRWRWRQQIGVNELRAATGQPLHPEGSRALW